MTRLLPILTGAALVASLSAQAVTPVAVRRDEQRPQAAAKNAIFFVGDGMGVSTVTAARIFSVGIDGKLVIDQFPYTALSRTYTSDFITPDSAGTMTAMMTGQNTNSGLIGLDATTERNDFNGDGDGQRLTTLLELAKQAGKSVGVVSTARITHATPAACYAKVNDRNKEDDIAAQAVPGDPAYNKMLGRGIDLLVGGGRRHFVPSGMLDEEGDGGRRTDNRDLRAEFQKAGYRYVWNERGWNQLGAQDLPILALFESSHMEYEYDRITDVGGEPSLTDIVAKAVALLSKNPKGYFLMVESGRIDHAHHAGNAWRTMVETEEFDEAIGGAVEAVNLRDTLIVVTADHSHVFNIAGYPMRMKHELQYQPKSAPAEWLKGSHGGIFNIVFGISASTGEVSAVTDSNGIPYTTLVYGNGAGYRNGSRMDPYQDTFKGFNDTTVRGPQDPNYLQEAAVPLSSETHSAEEVAIYAVGAGASALRGTVKNTTTFDLMKAALGL